MRNGTFKRLLERIVWVVLALLFVVKNAVDWIGKSTFVEDLTALWPKVGKVLEFIADQPGWLVYGLLAFLAGLLLLSISQNVEGLGRQRQMAPGPVAFVPDMHPKELFHYLCKDAHWATRFGADKLAWFNATKLALRDELLQGRVLRAQGRPAGKWQDGGFRYPADFIDRDFWRGGEINWMRLLNIDYSGDIDAYDPGHNGRAQVSFDDVKFCRREVEAIWPPRPWILRKFRPVPIEPFGKPPYGAAPWRQVDEESSA